MPGRIAGRLARVVAIVALAAGLVAAPPLVVATTSSPVGDTPSAWPSTWVPIRHAGGTPVLDSDADGSVPGPAEITSDGGTNPSAYVTVSNGTVFFRLRVAANPTDVADGGFAPYIWSAQLATLQGGVWTTRAVTGIDGLGFGDSGDPDAVYVCDRFGVPQDIYHFDTSIPAFDPSAGAVAGARVAPDGAGQYFVDWQVPLARITAASAGQITASTPVRIFFGTGQAEIDIPGIDFMMGGSVSFDDVQSMQLDRGVLGVTATANYQSGMNPPVIYNRTYYDVTVNVSDAGAMALSSAQVVYQPGGGFLANWWINSGGGGITYDGGSDRITYTPASLPASITVRTAIDPFSSGTYTVATMTGTATDAWGQVSTQTNVQVTVEPQSDTATSITCDSTTVMYGDTTTCHVTVTNLTKNTVPQGTVTFNPGKGTMPACSPVATGANTAACDSVFTATGGMSLSAGGGTTFVTFSGTPAFKYSTAQIGMTMTKRPLTATVNDATRAYGEENPGFSIRYSGFIGVDGGSYVGGDFRFTTSATPSSPVGTYSVSVGELTSFLYDVTEFPGTLTVTPAGLTIHADDKTKKYGEANPPLTASYDGLVAGDTGASLTGTLACTTTATPLSVPGDYPITCGGQTSTNYTVSYAAGNLHVGNATLTITPTGVVRDFGDPNPSSYAWTASGLVGSDDESVISGTMTCSVTAGQFSNVGVYPLTCSGLSAPGYDVVYAPANLAIQQRAVNAAPRASSMVYGDTPVFNYEITGFVNGDTQSVFSGTPSCTFMPDPAHVPQAGESIGFWCAPGSLAALNYRISSFLGSDQMAVTKRPATITVLSDLHTTFGDLPDWRGVPVVASWLVPSDVAAVLAATSTMSPAYAGPLTPVGNYQLRPSVESNAVTDNYDFTFVGARLYIEPRNLDIVPDVQVKPYGSANPPLTYSLAGIVKGDIPALTGSPTCSTAATTDSHPNLYPIRCDAGTLAAPNYTVRGWVDSGMDSPLIVIPAPLDVTTNDSVKSYGDTLPVFSVRYSGFVLGQNAAALNGTLGFSTSATAASGAGVYWVTPTGLSSPDYAIDFHAGTLTVDPAPLTVTALSASRLAGVTNPGFGVSFAGFKLGEDSSVLDGTLACSTTATTASHPGDYPISCGGYTSANYAINYVDGVLHVGNSVLTIQPAAASRVYGEPNPTTFTWKASGYIGDDDAYVVTGTLSCTTTATILSDVGSYPLTCSGLSAPGYDVEYSAASLQVQQRALTTIVAGSTRKYGAPDPTFSVSYDGFVNGDTTSVLTGTDICLPLATPNSLPDAYTVICFGQAATNYFVAVGFGTMTITNADLTVTVDGADRTYGDANPSTFTWHPSGFVAGDDASIVTGSLTCTTPATEASSVGTYPVTCTGLEARAYTITFLPATLAVGPRTVTPSAAASTAVYGDPSPAFAFSVAGLVNGDGIGVFSGAPACTITDTPSGPAPVGVHPITCATGTLSATNYTLDAWVNKAEITITPRPATISVANATTTYGHGAQPPSVTWEAPTAVRGVLAADLADVSVRTTVDLGGYAGTLSPKGSYTFTPSVAGGGVTTNYAFSYTSGTLTVEPAPLTVTVANVSRQYGAANPEMALTYAGFQNGETASVLGTPTWQGLPDAAAHAGVYPVTVTWAYTGNYAVTVNAGSVTVVPIAVTLAAGSVTVTQTPGTQDVTIFASLASPSDVTGGSMTFEVLSGSRVVASVTRPYSATDPMNRATLTLPAGLAAGTYTIRVTLNSTDFSAAPATATLTVNAATPTQHPAVTAPPTGTPSRHEPLGDDGFALIVAILLAGALLGGLALWFSVRIRRAARD